MLTIETERRVSKFFSILLNYELLSQKAKNELLSNELFNPYQCFKAIDKNNKNLRRVGNHYSFFQVGNISMEEDIDNKTIVRFEMINTKSKNEYFSKEFSIDTALIQKFTEILNLYLKLLGLETTSQSSQQ